MKGDFSRDTFDPRNHYSRVLMQQGRVQTDADWNEQQEIIRRRIETEAKDVIGSSGAPLHDAGFAITTHGKTLLISAGRMYVDGELVENETDALDYTKQPDLPDPPEILSLLKKSQSTSGIVYLDVWFRHLTALDSPHLREVALGGPDTATRAKVIWQVKVLPIHGGGDPTECDRLKKSRARLEEQLQKLVQAGAAPERIQKLKDQITAADKKIAEVCGDGSCKARFPEWDGLVASSTTMLNARTSPPQQITDECQIPPGAGYTRLENQLYRVEVHQGGNLPTNQVTFKWSRDNGTVMTLIEGINGQEIKVRDVGPDEALGFANGQFVEVTDDALELNGQPGELIQIIEVNAATRIITLKSKPTLVYDVTRHPKLRRWDSAGEVTVDGTWQALEAGVEVQFSKQGSCKTGDYWIIPARTATGDVEWPRDPNSQSPVARPPHGIRHHFARLALIGSTREQLQVSENCRCVFPPLCEVSSGTAATSGFHITKIAFSDGTLVTNGGIFDAKRLARGLEVVCGDSLSAESVNRATFSLTIEMPWPLYGRPLGSVDAGFWKTIVTTNTLPIFAFQPLILGAVPSVNPQDGRTARWVPRTPTTRLLTHFSEILRYSREKAILTHLVLKGNFIWEAKDPQVYLDGEAFGAPAGERVAHNLRLPSGDGTRGGDFEMWFWLR
jgi:hypothetical protein